MKFIVPAKRNHIGNLGEEVFKYLPDKKLKVLDIGTGEFLWSHPKYNMTYLDKREYFKRPDYIIHDLNEPLPFEDEIFDLVTGIEIIEHVFSPYNLFKECIRVLKPGGKLILTTPDVLCQKSRNLFYFRGLLVYFERPMLGELDDQHKSIVFKFQLEMWSKEFNILDEYHYYKHPVGDILIYKGVKPNPEYPRELSKILSDDIDLHFLYDYVKKLNPEIILELGVRGGFSTEVFLRAGCKKLVSIDIKDYPETRERLSMFKNWKFIIKDDIEFLKEMKFRPDIIFIDTSHEFKHTLQELKLATKKLAPGGLILCHDTLTWSGVKKAITKFIKENPEWKFKELGTDNGLGRLKYEH